jgi:4-diphosphocytidyl-2-C-methyl-D-erythritol kinase
VIVFPPAKVNIGLNVVRKRTDGYHDIETVMLAIPLYDGLEAVVDPSIPPDEVRYTRSGLLISGSLENDLVLRAHGLIRGKSKLPGIRMHLHKRLPMGAGLGGGSSDGAYALTLLDRLLGLRLPIEELRDMALTLGSDCPFFLETGAHLATGRGEVLTPVEVVLKDNWIAIVNPGVSVPTAEVYANIRPTGSEMDIGRAIASLPMRLWREAAPNIMEEYVFRTRPQVASAIELLLKAGAKYAAMSGSGSTVFGLFASKPPELEWPVGYMAWTLPLGQ